MKSIGSAIVFCVLGVASWHGSLLITVVNRVTESRGGDNGWLDGATLVAGRLDLFYWFLAVFALVSLLLYLLCAWLYTYGHDPRLQTIVYVEPSESTMHQAAV
jgi:solute carrier family 15 (peptide/histidine transporter), member 3/4